MAAYEDSSVRRREAKSRAGDFRVDPRRKVRHTHPWSPVASGQWVWTGSGGVQAGLLWSVVRPPKGLTPSFPPC